MRISIITGDETTTYIDTLTPTVSDAEFESTLAQATEALSKVQASQSATTTTAAGDTDVLACDASLEAIFQEAASTYNVDVNLLKAIAKQESNFTTTATSSSGAMGVMQLMPATAAGLGVTDAYDARQNIMGGAQLIAKHLETYQGDLSLALAAYNAGAGNVAKYGGIPPFAETQNYVQKVQQYYASASQSASAESSSSTETKVEIPEEYEQLLRSLNTMIQDKLARISDGQ